MNAVLTLVRLQDTAVAAPLAADGDLILVHAPAWSMRVWMIRYPLPQPNTISVPGGPVTDEHVVAFPGSLWWGVADILVASDEVLLRSATHWSVAALLVPDGHGLLRTRDGWSARLTPRTASSWRSAEETFGLYASFLHSWLVSGRPLEALDQAVLSVRGSSHRLDGDSSSRAAS